MSTTNMTRTMRTMGMMMPTRKAVLSGSVWMGWDQLVSLCCSRDVNARILKRYIVPGFKGPLQ